jgi:hypothetical protein
VIVMFRFLVFTLAPIVCPITLLVGLGLAAVMAMAAESRGRPKYINCPQCLDGVLVDAATCPHCGRKMK